MTYNRPQYLKKAVNAILSQSYEDFEFLIMDNGSSEETQEIIDTFRDSRIIKYRRENNSIDYMNQSFVVANGQYVIITHDDDIMMNNFLEEEVDVLNKNNDVVLVATNTQLIDSNDNVILKKSMKLKNDLIFKRYEYIAERIKSSVFLPCPTVMLRKCFIDEYSLRFNFEVGPSFDDYLWYRINLYEAKLFLIKDALYKYRIHGNQLTNPLTNITMRLQIYPYVQKLLKESGNSGLMSDYKNKSIKSILNYLMSAYSKNQINKIEFNAFYSNLLEMGMKSYEVPSTFRVKKYICEKIPGIYRILQG